MRGSKDTTATASASARVLGAYEAVVALATSAAGARASAPELDLAAEARRMRAAFERRTGAFGPEDPWFETRSRAFWDDALTTQGFAALAAPHAGDDANLVARSFAEAHRGLFVALEVLAGGAHIADLWSGAELFVGRLDEAQRIALEHADGAFDARVVRGPADAGAVPELFVLPGALHHPPDALPAMREVIAAAKERGLDAGAALDALLRMEHVMRSSSRVKAAFAYRIESLPRR